MGTMLPLPKWLPRLDHPVTTLQVAGSVEARRASDEARAARKRPPDRHLQGEPWQSKARVLRAVGTRASRRSHRVKCLVPRGNACPGRGPPERLARGPRAFD